MLKIDSNPSLVPEAASLPNVVIAFYLDHQSSLQFVISPVKSFQFVLLSNPAGLSLCTTNGNTVNRNLLYLKFIRIFTFFLNLWTLSPIKAMPERTEFGASPEPVPLFLQKRRDIFR